MLSNDIAWKPCPVLDVHMYEWKAQDKRTRVMLYAPIIHGGGIKQRWINILTPGQ